MALALAGSLFFSISPAPGPRQVALYLVLTMAPFALVAPLIGPWLDRVRGGRRWVLVGANALRAVICRLDDRPPRQPAAVPRGLRGAGAVEELPGGQVGPGAHGGELRRRAGRGQLEAVAALGHHGLRRGHPRRHRGAGWSAARAPLFLAAVAFIGAALLAVADPGDPGGRRARRHARARRAARRRHPPGGLGHGLLRGIVGFLTFLLAFDLRGDDDRRGVRRGAGGQRPRVAARRAARPRRCAGPRCPRSASCSCSSGSPRRSACVSACSAGIVGAALLAAVGRAWPRAPASWPSTRSSSATPPTPTGAGRSPASRPASSSSGWSGPSSRWWSTSRPGSAS